MVYGRKIPMKPKASTIWLILLAIVVIVVCQQYRAEKRRAIFIEQTNTTKKELDKIQEHLVETYTNYLKDKEKRDADRERRELDRLLNRR